ncbi:uncharacterized protein [Lolium perenne]|uniref:uncharacterized protein n=1 Tax=Lolium perenne TaxID=4522 RepID=UPI003A99D63B
MKAGRKNLQRACQDGSAVTLAEGESIMQVVTLRGSNLIEVTDGEGVKSLALFPAKFQKSFWIKNGAGHTELAHDRGSSYKLSAPGPSVIMSPRSELSAPVCALQALAAMRVESVCMPGVCWQ